MKKLLLGTMLVLSVASFGGMNDLKEDNLEIEISQKYNIIKDGINENPVKDIDVDIYMNNQTKVDIELYEGTGNISAVALDSYAKEIADFVRKDLGNKNQVLVKIEIDRDGLLGDKQLYFKYN